jgi:hypothetical protein
MVVTAEWIRRTKGRHWRVLRQMRTDEWPVYGCETWFLTLGEEPRLKVFENSVEDIWT